MEIPIKREVGMVRYPAGRFLKISILPNTAGRYNFSGNWDVKPGEPTIKLVGTGQKYLQYVFEFKGELYTRAYRHQVERQAVSSYLRHYRLHPQPVGRHSILVLKPFTGEFEPGN